MTYILRSIFKSRTIVGHTALHPTASTSNATLLGYAALALAVNQYISGWLRGSKGGPTDPRSQMRGDHYDMTRLRVLFEHLHKPTGYVAVICAMSAILTGLWQANAPIYLWIGIVGFWCALGVVITLIALRLKRVPTYEAIWGPDQSPNR